MTKMPEIGDPLPWVDVPTTREERLPLKGLAGHAVVITSAGYDIAAATLTDALEKASPILGEHSAYWMVIAPTGSADTEYAALANPRARIIIDTDGAARRALGIAEEHDGLVTLATDPSLRVTATAHHQGGEASTELETWLSSRLVGSGARPVDMDAPVILIPDVIEPELRDALMKAWDGGAHEASGYLRENADGGVTHVINPNRKRRRDLFLEDSDPLAARVHARIRARVAPWIERATHFKIGFAERYRIACYEAETAGFFAPHRDFTESSPHRHFAMTIALNDNYQGGALRFPEFGAREYSLLPGQAIVYAGGLLHEVTPMTQGRRFALINFLTNGEGAKNVAAYQRAHGVAPERATAG
jgi:predicted 2-oxoglutarate/Fe(II)-dependent dioxygenase YbiX